jgi:hypothetical protein
MRTALLSVIRLAWLLKGSSSRAASTLTTYGHPYVHPISRHATMRALFSTVAHRGWEMDQVDYVTTAFLHGELDNEVFMEMPPGFETPGLVCKLKRSIYGLRQAPRAWHAKLEGTLKKIDLRPSMADPALWLGNDVIVLLYVDDALIASRNRETVERAKQKLSEYFKLRNLKEARAFLSLSIERDRKKGLLKVHQGNYVEELLNRFKMEDCVPRSVPLTSGRVIVKKGKTLGHEVPFGSLVGASMYLATCTRPDIAYVVGQLSRYMAAPTVEHWTNASRLDPNQHATAHEIDAHLSD